MDNSDGENEEIEYEPVEEDVEEIEARLKPSTSFKSLVAKKEHEKRVGLQQLDHLIRKRISKEKPLFANKIWKKKHLEKFLHDCFTYALFSSIGGLDSLEKEELTKLSTSCETIHELNVEICGKLVELGGLPYNFDEATLKFPTMAIMKLNQLEVLKKKNNSIGAEVLEKERRADELLCAGSGHSGDLSAKQAECCLTLGNFLNTRYDDREDLYNRAEFLLCDRHFSLCKIYFELSHMERNFHCNAQYQINRVCKHDEDITPKEKVDRVTDKVYQGMIGDAMGRYHRLLIFGTTEQLEKWGTEPYYEQEKRLHQEIYPLKTKRKSRTGSSKKET